MRNWLCAFALLLAATFPSWAASRTETQAFEAAAKAFRDGIWERAEGEFGAFRQKFPKSERLAEAVLLQAQARCKLADYRRALELLTAEQAGAGPLADQYAFWIGEAHFESTNYPAAAEAYRRVLNDFPQSKLRLEAAVNEAAAWAGLKDWARVEDLLSQPAGTFQQLAPMSPANELVARGILLLGEAHVASRNFEAAEKELRKLDERGLHPALAWRRMYLLCRALLGRGLAEQALLNTADLVALAKGTAQPALIAESLALRAGTLEGLGRLESAADAYSQNLTSNAPVELQRQAMLKLAELALVRGAPEEAAQKLEDFLQRYPNSPECDTALLTLGELYLKQHVSGITGTATNAVPTNALLMAQTSFEALRKRFPDSAWLGKAELNRGWCLWQTNVWLTNDIPGSAAAFAAAAKALPPSYDRAVAFFKLADAQFQQNQFATAIDNYNAVVASADSLPAVKTNLCEPALYQIVRAGIEITDAAATDAAVGKLLAWFPESYVTESGLLIAGQGLARHGDPAAARRLLKDLLQRFPGSEHGALVRLQVARTHELRTHKLEPDWGAAVQEYESWLTAYPTNAERPRAEYALALASYQAGDETNALRRFTNFIALSSTHALAPLAQWWVADYHFRRGEFVDAEKNYQLIFQTWSNSPLAFEARMMAGRTAMKRQGQGWVDAIGYFTNLTSRLDCRSNLWVEAAFACSDALRHLEPADTNRPLANFEEAVRVLAKIHDCNATNVAAARAYGEIGNCYLQLAVQDANKYTNAVDAFRQATNMWADVAARCQAHVGLGIVAEKLAARETGEAQTRLLKEALNHYLDVLYDKQLGGGERPVAYWLKRAGLDAARLAETLQDWPQAIQLYRRLQALLPPLKAMLDKKIEQAGAHIAP